MSFRCDSLLTGKTSYSASRDSSPVSQRSRFCFILWDYFHISHRPFRPSSLNSCTPKLADSWYGRTGLSWINKVRSKNTYFRAPRDLSLLRREHGWPQAPDSGSSGGNSWGPDSSCMCTRPLRWTQETRHV